MMIGSEPPELEHRTANTGDTVLRVQGLSLRSQDPLVSICRALRCRCVRAKSSVLPASPATARKS
jgi:hypothetical protein